jgi:hypothetical protein
MHGIVLPDQLGRVGQAPPDDTLDAAAVVWPAHRTAICTVDSHPAASE